jgi:hypothetical protein
LISITWSQYASGCSAACAQNGAGIVDEDVHGGHSVPDRADETVQVGPVGEIAERRRKPAAQRRGQAFSTPRARRLLKLPHG